MDRPSERDAIAALHRRAGFGLGAAELEAATARGAGATIDRLVDPDAHGVAPAPDPWGEVALAPAELPGKERRAWRRDAGRAAVASWIDAMATTPRPLEAWLTWYWHGHFVSALDKVVEPAVLVRQLRLLRALALGPFPDLVRAVTTDPAMLLYLDGDRSQGKRPNENYGRELLELFTVGRDAHTEADVAAAARALSGWQVEDRGLSSRLAPQRHDDTPQVLLGRAGVHDVATVVDAVTDHPACARFVAGRLGRAILGDVGDDVVDDLAAAFARSGLEVRALVRAALEAVAEGRAAGLVLAPVPWLAAARRATGAALSPGQQRRFLAQAGQVPLSAPNVAGWPGGAAWLATSAVVARVGAAADLAEATPDAAPALVAARAGRAGLADLATALGRPAGLSPETGRAVAELAALDARGALAVALASPDLAVA